MAYKSLYRKYRPNNFEEVSGQKFIIKTLKNAIYNNKISHAYLFTGTRGTGKTTIAKIFAKMVNCMNPKDNIPCGKCEICTNINTDEIQDIIEIDAASNNGVDEIRELKNKIKLVPVMCNYKVYIIDEVHMLSTGAFNALLKTLEEPPSHVIFILATTEPQKLPITIISRCQRFDFKRISIEDIIERLKYISKEEKINISEEAIMEISKMSDGALRDAIGLLEQVSSFSDKKITIEDIYSIGGNVSNNTLLDLINKFISRDIKGILKSIEEIYLDGKDFYKLSEALLLFFRNILICKKAYDYFIEIEITNKEEIIKISNELDLFFIEKTIKSLEKLLGEIKISNYPRILFEIFMLQDIELEIKEENQQLKEEIKMELKEEPKKLENNEKKEKLTIDIVEDINTKEIQIDFGENMKIKKVLINNTIAMANSKSKKAIQEIFNDLDKYITNNKYKVASTILKDCNIAAASEDHILLTYKYIGMVESNDKEIGKIEKFLKETMNCCYKVVAITEDDWKKERPYYLNLKKQNKKIEIKEEIKPTENTGGSKDNQTNSRIDDILNTFGKDLVEMEG